MYYIVFHSGIVVYTGEVFSKAIVALHDTPGSSLHSAKTPAEIDELVAEFAPDHESGVGRVREILSSMGIDEEFVNRLRVGGDRAACEARRVGTAGVRAIGDGLVAFGEMLRGSK